MFRILPPTLVQLVVLSVCLAATACALFFFARANRHAWLKTIMHAWYTAACVVGVVDMLTISAYPWTKPYWTLFFNLAGQCMATTGILDVLQLRYCAPRLLMLADTNASYLRLCIAAYGLASLGFGAAFAVYATTSTGLLAYRIATAAVIFGEVLGYCWVLIRKFSCSWRRAQLKARVYYLATLFSRVGIVLGIVLRLMGINHLGISGVHSAAVVVAVASVAAAGKATEIAIRLHNSKRGSMVMTELSSARLRWSGRVRKVPPTSESSMTISVSEPHFSEPTFSSVQGLGSPTLTALDEWIPQPSVFVALNRVLARVGGPDAPSLPVGDGIPRPSRTADIGLSDYSDSEA